MTKLVYHNYGNNNVIRAAAAGVIVVGECRRRELSRVVEKSESFYLCGSQVARFHFHAALDRNRAARAAPSKQIILKRSVPCIINLLVYLTENVLFTKHVLQFIMFAARRQSQAN